MRKIIFGIAFAIMPFISGAADNPPAPRVSIFSTTTDWAALTGLPLRQFTGDFKWSNADVGRGMVLYYLDAFPCYGEADSVRIWLGPNKQREGKLRLVCVASPTEVSFAWRTATRDADQAQSTGILKCPVTGEYDFTVDMSKCTRGPDWSEYK